MTAMPPPLPPAFPPTLQPLTAEIHTYFRELPGLLDGGNDGRFVVVKGDGLFGVWDTQWGAIQFGREKFPDGVFLAQEIDRRFLDVFGEHFARAAAAAPEAA
ncbi:MAG: hypothetical protein K2X87_27710 [Gemmataceae bacterium]|nr:hypothetical protein [Gemmataceae bacterium]